VIVKCHPRVCQIKNKKKKCEKKMTTKMKTNAEISYPPMLSLIRPPPKQMKSTKRNKHKMKQNSKEMEEDRKGHVNVS